MIKMKNISCHDTFNLESPKCWKKKLLRKQNKIGSNLQMWTKSPGYRTVYVTRYWKFPEVVARVILAIAAEHVYKTSF